MAAGVPARLTAAQGRRFAFTVGGAFLVFAAVAWWRDHLIPSYALGTIGTILAAAGALVPTRLGGVERAWMALAHQISRVTTPVVMGMMYLVVLTPVGLLRRAFGGNPLSHGLQQSSYWKSRPEGRRAGNLTRQF
jgi:hypothetical protein